MSNGNSKHTTNSGMSDGRWLSNDRRLYADSQDLFDHAEAADELIAELAEALRRHDDRYRVGPGAITADGALLARVDALTKDGR